MVAPATAAPSAVGIAASVASSPGFGIGTTVWAAVSSAWDVYSTLAHPVITPQSIVETTRLRFRPDNPIATIPPLS
jgi:hypothetical protein